MPLLSTPTIDLDSPSSKNKTWKHLSKHCRPHSCFHFQGLDLSPIVLHGAHNRLTSISLQGIKGDSGQTIPKDQVGGWKTPISKSTTASAPASPRNGQDRDRPLSDHPRIGLPAACRPQGGLEEWPNTADTAPTNSLTPHDQHPNSDQKHGQCQTDFITRPPDSRTDLGPHLQHGGRTTRDACLALFCSSAQVDHSSPASRSRGRPRRPAGATRDQRAGKQSSNGAACNSAGKNILAIYFCIILCRRPSPCGQLCPGFLNLSSK